MPDPIFPPGGEQRLPRVIPVVVVLIRMRHPVVQIIRLVDLAIRRGELMEDGGDL